MSPGWFRTGSPAFRIAHAGVGTTRLRRVAWQSLFAIGLLAPGCSGSQAEPPVSARQAIELSQLGSVFALAGSLSDARPADARLRETASFATGALLSPLVENGVLKVATNGTLVRTSCGATLIAPSYAVTAAHCVDANTMDLSSLVLEMYRPTGLLVESYQKMTALGGIFPDYTHGRLTGEDGYFVERFPCTVAGRCGDAYGPAVACASGVSSVADTALLFCQDRPGDKFGFLELAAEDDMTAEVFLPWKHEIYDIPDDVHDDRTLHYAVYSDELAGNYHYHGANLAGIEQNQLLPLISIPFSDGTKPSKLEVADVLVVTDLLGCHGTSGAGVLQPGHSGWELLGPALHGNDELNFFLCNHVPSLGVPNGPGMGGVVYGSLACTLSSIEELRPQITADSLALPSGATSLFTGPAFAIANLGGMPGNADFVKHLASPSVRHPLDVLGGTVLALAGGAAVDLVGFKVAAGQSYRLGMQAWSGQGCAAEPCPALLVSMDGQPALRHVLRATTQGPVSLAAEITATADKIATLSFATESAVAAEIGAISLVPSRDTTKFDSWRERLGAVMQDLTAAAHDARPGRFVGDGRNGFEARLLPKERLLLVRQALVSQRAWTIAFTVSGGASLLCGLIDDAGTILSQAACSDGNATFEDSQALPEDTARAAVFVENNSETQAALIDDIALSAGAIAPAPAEPSVSDAGADSAFSDLMADGPPPFRVHAGGGCDCNMLPGRRFPVAGLLGFVTILLAPRLRRRS